MRFRNYIPTLSQSPNIIDCVNNGSGGSSSENTTSSTGTQKPGSGFISGLRNKVKPATGVIMDQYVLVAGIDMVQDKVVDQGPQNKGTAFEQVEDEQIMDYSRGRYNSSAGSDMSIKDKGDSLPGSRIEGRASTQNRSSPI